MFAEIARACGSVATVAKCGARAVVVGRTGSSQAARATVRQSAMTLRMRDSSPERRGAGEAKALPPRALGNGYSRPRTEDRGSCVKPARSGLPTDFLGPRSSILLALRWPQPPEGPRDEQPIHQTIERELEGGAPFPVPPDRVL